MCSIPGKRSEDDRNEELILIIIIYFYSNSHQSVCGTTLWRAVVATEVLTRTVALIPSAD